MQPYLGCLQEDDVDPLDAFMAAAVNPEVVAAEKAEAARKAELRSQQLQALAVRLHLLLAACIALTKPHLAAGHVSRK